MASSDTFVNVRNLFEISGRNYIVTGGAQGIGLAITRSIAQMGGNVVALDIKEKPSDGFDELSNKYQVKTEYIQADVRNEESHTSAFNRAVEVLGSIDGCVTCAGIAIEKPFEEQTWEEVRKVQDVNVIGTFFTTQLAAKQMKKQGTGGSIVLIASITAHTVLPHHRMAAYSASKGAVKMLSESLAVELAPYKIRTNTISPGFIDTEMTQAVRNVNAKIAEIMFKAPPLQRIGTREDLVGAAIYLLSDASAYTTGADIAITGGLHIGRIDT